jgi:hypothetical protein
MRVKYISGSTSSLTKGKYYDIIHDGIDYSGELYYVVLGDNGFESWDYSRKFNTLSEERDNKINELLNESKIYTRIKSMFN